MYYCNRYDLYTSTNNAFPHPCTLKSATRATDCPDATCQDDPHILCVPLRFQTLSVQPPKHERPLHHDAGGGDAAP